MKLVKAHGNAELVKGPKKARGPRMPKIKTKGTQEPISRKNQWPYQATGGKSK